MVYRCSLLLNILHTKPTLPGTWRLLGMEIWRSKYILTNFAFVLPELWDINPFKNILVNLLCAFSTIFPEMMIWRLQLTPRIGRIWVYHAWRMLRSLQENHDSQHLLMNNLLRLRRSLQGKIFRPYRSTLRGWKHPFLSILMQLFTSSVFC